MRQFIAIAVNAFMELVRQPVFLLLMTCSAAFSVFLSAVPYFGFGDDPKLVKDSAMAVTLLSGLLGAVLSASASLAKEIRSGTALAVLAKPIGRTPFLLAKYLGLATALTLLTYVNLVAALLASRMAFDAYGEADKTALAIFFGALVLAYALAGFSNYFLRRPFVADAVFAVTGLATGAFVIVGVFIHKELAFGEVAAVDWRLVPAGVLILFALWLLAGVALAVSTRFELIPTLAICTGVFLLGLMSDYLFGQRAEPVWTGDLRAEIEQSRRSEAQKTLLREVADRYDLNRTGRLEVPELEKVAPEDEARMLQAGLGGARWASVLYTVVPNWQLFWLADALEDKREIPWSYVGRAFGYVAGYLGALLVLAVWMFEDRELS